LCFIPDSIDILSFHESLGDLSQALNSGVDSKLSEIRATSVLGTHQCQSFLQVSTRSSKHFRLKWQFERGASGVESDWVLSQVLKVPRSMSVDGVIASPDLDPSIRFAQM
jgi:hypothetical protein